MSSAKGQEVRLYRDQQRDQAGLGFFRSRNNIAQPELKFHSVTFVTFVTRFPFNR
jgi:hypothetical protein